MFEGLKLCLPTCWPPQVILILVRRLEVIRFRVRDLGGKEPKRRRADEAHARAARDHSPPHDVEEEISAASDTLQFDLIRKLCQELLRPKKTTCVRVPRTAPAPPVILWEAQTGQRLLRQLMAALEQGHNARSPRWNWRNTVRALSLLGILKAYSYHPSQRIVAEVNQLRARLQTYTAASPAVRSAPQLHPGSGRSAGQVGYHTVHLHAAMMRAVQAYDQRQAGPLVLLVIGKPVEHGFAACCLMAPSV